MIKNLQIFGGLAAILEATIYIIAFIIYGAVLEYPPVGADAMTEINFLQVNLLILSVMNLVVYVLFGVLLCVLVLALHDRVKLKAPVLAQMATVFGLIWVALVIASGMIGNIGLTSVLKLQATDIGQAMTVWNGVGIVTEGLGGGNEVVGGLWVLLLSIAGLQTKVLSKPLNVLGILVGSSGILSIYPAEIFTEIFGLSQIIWFIWVGVLLIKSNEVTSE